VTGPEIGALVTAGVSLAGALAAWLRALAAEQKAKAATARVDKHLGVEHQGSGHKH